MIRVNNIKYLDYKDKLLIKQCLADENLKISSLNIPNIYSKINGKTRITYGEIKKIENKLGIKLL